MNENDQVGGGGSGESHNNQTLPRTKSNKSRKLDSSSRDQQGDEIWYREVNDKEDGEENQEDEVWNSFNDGFRQVQSLLDRNRILIQQVNENHRSKIAENMVKNVALIQEMNANISKIVCIYSDLSNDFSTVFHHRAAAVENGNCVDNSD